MSHTTPIRKFRKIILEDMICFEQYNPLTNQQTSNFYYEAGKSHSMKLVKLVDEGRRRSQTAIEMKEKNPVLSAYAQVKAEHIASMCLVYKNVVEQYKTQAHVYHAKHMNEVRGL